MIGIVAALLSATSSAAPTTSPAYALCTGQGDSKTNDERIAACSTLISSSLKADGMKDAENLAEIYLTRCDLQLDQHLRVAAGWDKAKINDSKLLQTALQDCSKAIALKPDYVDAFSKRAFVFSILENYDKAIADYDRTLELQPDRDRSLTLRGLVYLDKGDYDRALADCSLALKHGYDIAGFAEDCVTRAEAAKKQIAAGQKLGDPRAWCDGNALAQEGYKQDRQIDGCTILIKSGKETRDNLIRDYFYRASAYDDESKRDLAIADYKTVIRMKPDYADAYGRIGAHYWVMGKYKSAITYLSKAIALQGSRMDMYIPYRGNSYYETGQYTKAITDFNTAIINNPTASDVFVSRSYAFNAIGQYDRAIADADQAIKLSPRSGATEAFDSRGDAHFLKGDFAGAINDYDEALKLWPENSKALYGRGAAKSRNGDIIDAQADIKAAVKLQADVARIKAKRGITPSK